MIEGPQRGASSSSGPGRRGFSVARVVAQAQGRLGVLWQRLAPAGAGRVPSDPFLWRLRLIDRAFWGILVVLGVYVVVDLLMPVRRVPAIAAPSVHLVTPNPQDEGPTAAEQQLRPVAEYRELLASKDPFGLGSAHGRGGAAGTTVRSRLEEMIAKLSVVGINRSRVPEALIEDTEAKRTYFLKVGDEVNGLAVTAIDQRGVTLRYEGEDITLQ